MTGRGIGAAVTLVLVLLIGLGTGLREVYFIVFVLDILLLYACLSALLAAAESRERPWETAACLHNIVNCTAFMLKSLLAMWKNGFHNAVFGRETRQPAHRYPYWSRKSEQQNGNCI